jgi:hypothetical protein
MGYGEYDYEAHESATQARAKLPAAAVFKQGACHPEMLPRGVRESRDSAKHPDSVGIVFALDVSGSMGEIPQQLATKTLPGFMRAVTMLLPDAQVLFMALGSAYEHRSPLQVGQFESEDALIDKWLSALHLEGGGEMLGESYELAMYFAARHTAMDCGEKRGRRGYFFMTGDEPPYIHVNPAQAQALIGDTIPDNIPVEAMIDELATRFHPFFLIPDPKRALDWQVESVWRRLLGDCVIVLDRPEDTADAAALLIGIREGALRSAEDMDGLLEKLGRTPAERDRVIRVVAPYAEAVARGGGDPPKDRPHGEPRPPTRAPG